MTEDILYIIGPTAIGKSDYAIKLARYYIHSGRETSLKEILRDVRKHPDPKYIEELKSIDDIEKEAQARNASTHE